jgi:hypothetical protein
MASGRHKSRNRDAVTRNLDTFAAGEIIDHVEQVGFEFSENSSFATW